MMKGRQEGERRRQGGWQMKSEGENKVRMGKPQMGVTEAFFGGLFGLGIWYWILSLCHNLHTIELAVGGSVRL